ncbi:MAG: DNA repair protein RecO [Phycisphaeraceae bacterium]
MSRFKDQAVCIRHIDWSETSQVVALFTREQGKVRGLAKGSRRTSPGAIARFSGGIDLLTRGEVIATIKPTTELAAITEWDLQDPFHHLRTDLTAWRLGMYAADLAGALTADHDAHPVTFDAMVRFLEAIGEESAKPRAAGGPGAQAVLLRFQWDVLSDCGFKPELKVDVRSGEALDERDGAGAAASAASGALVFDARAGGLTREAVESVAAGRVSSGGPWRVRKETVALLRSLDEGKGAAAVEAMDAERLTRANRLLCVYVRAIVDRELPTMGFVLNGERG